MLQEGEKNKRTKAKFFRCRSAEPSLLSAWEVTERKFNKTASQEGERGQAKDKEK